MMCINCFVFLKRENFALLSFGVIYKISSLLFYKFYLMQFETYRKFFKIVQGIPYTLYPDVPISFICPISILSSPQFQPQNIRFTLVFFFYIFIMPLTMKNTLHLCSIYLPVCVCVAYRKSGFRISIL